MKSLRMRSSRSARNASSAAGEAGGSAGPRAAPISVTSRAASASRGFFLQIEPAEPGRAVRVPQYVRESPGLARDVAAGPVQAQTDGGADDAGGQTGENGAAGDPETHDDCVLM